MKRLTYMVNLNPRYEREKSKNSTMEVLVSPVLLLSEVITSTFFDNHLNSKHAIQFNTIQWLLLGIICVKHD